MISRAERHATDRALLGDRAVDAARASSYAMTDVERVLDQLMDIDVFIGELRQTVAVRTALRQTRGAQHRFETTLAGINPDYHMTKPEQASLRSALDAKTGSEAYLLRRKGYHVGLCEPYAATSSFATANEAEKSEELAGGAP